MRARVCVYITTCVCACNGVFFCVVGMLKHSVRLHFVTSTTSPRRETRSTKYVHYRIYSDCTYILCVTNHMAAKCDW